MITIKELVEIDLSLQVVVLYKVNKGNTMMILDEEGYVELVTREARKQNLIKKQEREKNEKK